jgi:D-glycero-D-manno-heptose 1,7-bisphosphate phosphatase
VYHCPYHPVHGLGEYKRESEFRKPAPGMILQACREFDIDPARSILLGDKHSDMQAGHSAGIRHNVLYSAVEQGSSSINKLQDLARWFTARIADVDN